MYNNSQAALDAALLLVTHGIPCFPCLENKRPACANGFKAATSNTTALCEMWRQYPGSLIGVPTGSLTGFDVLDVDPRNGGNEWWGQVHQSIPPTQTHRTRSGGLHVLFKHREGIRISASKIAPGIDVRGDKGYIIWWPAAGFEVFHHGVLAEWPEWIVHKILPPTGNVRSSFAATQPSSRYAQVALRKAVESIASAPEGTRNQQLNTEVYSLGRFIQNGELSPQQIAISLARAALSAGLEPTEIKNTIVSALRAQGV